MLLQIVVKLFLVHFFTHRLQTLKTTGFTILSF